MSLTVNCGKILSMSFDDNPRISSTDNDNQTEGKNLLATGSNNLYAEIEKLK